MSETTTLIALNCNHCGAALQVGQDTRFVTCTYCGTRLEVHHSSGAAYTSLLQLIDQRTEQIADDVEIIKLRSQVEQLDREWQAQRETLKRPGSSGAYRESGNAKVIIIGGFGAIWTIATFAMAMHCSAIGAPIVLCTFAWCFPPLGIAFIIAAVASGVRSAAAGASGFSIQMMSYQMKRESLVNQIEQHKK